VSWEDVGNYVRRERHRRRQTQAEFADEIGVSTRVLGAIEAAERTRYQPETRSAIESALGWRAGTIDQLVENGAYFPDFIDPDFARIRDAWPRMPAHMRTHLAEMAARAARQQ
jgi:transcriptional regulator with XRE-family HTH domain